MIRIISTVLVCLVSLCAIAGCKKGTCDESLLPGTWLSANYSVDIADGLAFEAAGAPNLAEIDVTGSMSTDGCELFITDTGGQFACPEEQVGHYSFTISASELRLTLIEDACEGRRIPLDGARLKRD